MTVMMIEYTCLHKQQWCVCWWLNPIQSLVKSVRHYRGRQGKGISMSTTQKRGNFTEESQHFCPSLSECKIVILHTS